MNTEIKPWIELESRLLAKARVFELHVRRMRSPYKDYEDDFYVVKSSDWINIIPLTDNLEVVMIEQYRFGIASNTLELPGGILDKEDPSPMVAALREMQEETGYAASEAESLGSVHPNPAIQDNTCHSFVARGVKLKSAQNLDPAENIAVKLIPLAEIPKLIEEGKISHSLMVVAFYRYFAKYPLE